jgi:ribosomal protein L37E
MSDYTIAADNRSITCHRCGKTSYNLNDVQQRYCANCKRFHDDGGLPIWIIYDHPRDFPDDLVLVTLDPRFRCTKCGRKGGNSRPDWTPHTMTGETMLGWQWVLMKERSRR